MHTQAPLKILALVASCTLATSLYAQAPSSNSSQTAAESANAAFVQQAGQGGLAEVELSKLAVISAKSPQIRSFAEKMVHDHTENNRQLATIAAHENIRMPQNPDGEHAQLHDKLASERGVDFDRDYVDAMRADHQKMIDLLKSSEATVNTEETRTFIKKTLPVVQAHLQMAQNLKTE
jgi:putative membrane protein